MSNRIDIGDDHFISFVGWWPDRDLNPQYDGIPDVENWGVNVEHKKPDGSACMSFATFDGEAQRKIDPATPKWTVESMEPLTLSPSLLCRLCGDHGFIKQGKWVRA
jgi:hypothetical protein